MLRASLFLSFILWAFVGHAQIELNPDPTIGTTSANCMMITPGTALTFERGSACGGAFIVSNTLSTSTSLLTTTDDVFSYDFPAAGEYIIFCNAASSTGPEANDAAICISVTEAIPTMSEWGVIITFLTLMIFMTVAYRNHVAEEALT